MCVLLTLSEFSSQTSLNRPCLRFLVHFGQFGLLLALVVWASTTLFPAEFSVLILMGVPFLMVNTQDETNEPLLTMINHDYITMDLPFTWVGGLGGYLLFWPSDSTQWTWGLEVLSVEVPSIKYKSITHDGSGWCWYINANMTGVYWCFIPNNIAAPWIHHGSTKSSWPPRSPDQTPQNQRA